MPKYERNYVMSLNSGKASWPTTTTTLRIPQFEAAARGQETHCQIESKSVQTPSQILTYDRRECNLHLIGLICSGTEQDSLFAVVFYSVLL